MQYLHFTMPLSLYYAIQSLSTMVLKSPKLIFFLLEYGKRAAMNHNFGFDTVFRVLPLSFWEQRFILVLVFMWMEWHIPEQSTCSSRPKVVLCSGRKRAVLSLLKKYEQAEILLKRNFGLSDFQFIFKLLLLNARISKSSTLYRIL